MPVKIRLARRGRRKNPYYHIIVADSRAPRDGRFIEQIGSYNPMTKPATIDLDRDKALDWLMKGAQPTDTARAILKFKGVLYRRHLMRGVTKGALTQEQADSLYNQFVENKESKVLERIEEARKEREAFWLAVSGSTKQKAPDMTGDKEALSAFQESPDSNEFSVDQETTSDSSASDAGESESATAAETTVEVGTEPEEVVEAVVEESPVEESPVEESPVEESTVEASTTAEEATEAVEVSDESSQETVESEADTKLESVKEEE